MGAGKMTQQINVFDAQRLRALAVLQEVLSSIPNDHMVAHSHL